MQKAVSVKRIWCMAKITYGEWIWNPKLLAVLVLMMIFCRELAVMPMVRAGELIGDRPNLLEPLISVMCSKVLMSSIPFAFLAILGSFPRRDVTTPMTVSRIGRKNWLWGSVLALGLCTLTIVALLTGGILLMSAPYTKFSFAWSAVVRDFTNICPEYENSYMANMITENMYNQMRPVAGGFQTILFLLMELFLFGMIQILAAVNGLEQWGTLFSCMLAGGGAVLCLLNQPLMWCFPMAHSLIWFHFTKYLREPIVPMWASYLYFGIGISGLALIQALTIRKMKF